MTVTIIIERERETKRTVRYKEQGEDGRIGIVYVPKGTLDELGNPDQIELTFSPR